MSGFYFDSSELEGLKGEGLVQAANTIRQRFNQRFAFYVNESAPKPYDLDLFDKYLRFTAAASARWSELNQEWKAVSEELKNNNTGRAIKFFERLNSSFEEFEKEFSEVSVPNIPSDGEALAHYKQDILNRVDAGIDEKLTKVQENINDEFEKLLNIKAEIEVERGYADSIRTNERNSNILAFMFFSLYLIIPVVVIYVFFLTFNMPAAEDNEFFVRYVSWVQNLSVYEVVALRGSILGFGWLMLSFIHSHYKFYRIKNIRYSHQRSLLGGGATFINELVKESPEEIKNDTYVKVINKFVDADDVADIFYKDKDPTNKTIERSVDLVSKIYDRVNEKMR